MDAEGKQKIEIILANENDIDKISEFHINVFKDYFLSNLGIGVVKKFYQEYVKDEDSYCIIAVDRNEIIGSILVSKNKNALNSFYKRNFLYIFLNILKQIIIINSIVIHGLYSRGSYIRLAFRSLFFNSQIEVNESKVSTRLLSIAVSKEYRGKNIAENMMKFIEDILKEKDIKEIGLSVRKNNDRAIRFYEKNGWKEEYNEEDAIYFIKLL